MGFLFLSNQILFSENSHMAATSTTATATPAEFIYGPVYAGARTVCVTKVRGTPVCFKGVSCVVCKSRSTTLTTFSKSSRRSNKFFVLFLTDQPLNQTLNKS